MQCLTTQQSSGMKQRLQLSGSNRRPAALRVQAAAAKAAAGGKKQQVAVQLTPTSFSSRKLVASVDIHAPVPVVWNALTDYDNLASFIPSLVENRCIERRERGCLLYQVGAQDVALGIKFSAACTLEIKEYPGGIPQRMCTASGDMNRYFPSPTSSSSTATASTSTPNSPYSSMTSSMSSFDCDELEAASSSGDSVRDISFKLVNGDFQAFKGIWRMERGLSDAGSTTLHYSLFVRPHPWLPVKLIEDRISTEVVNNLNAVRRHAERVHKLLQQQQKPAAGASSTVSSTVTSGSISEAEASGSS